MTVHYLHRHQQPCAALAQPLLGESAMAHAPAVVLANGHRFIPQHYLHYQHTVDSIQQIVSDIDYADHVPLFAGEDNSGMYVQVGLIGRENYDRGHHLRPQKLVYGRKWRINSDTPTSEIIQTVFLAIKKAREHEVRELLTLVDQHTGKTSTPFSNHQDLPLLANNRELVLNTLGAGVPLNEWVVRDYLQGVRFGERGLDVMNVEQRHNGDYLVDLALGGLPLARQVEGDMSEFDGIELTLVLKQTRRSALLYALIDALVMHSDLHVEAHFSYQGYHRFSRDNDPAHIAGLSIASRPYARDARNATFNAGFKASNYDVDASRTPDIGAGKLAAKNQQLLAQFFSLQGHMPTGYLNAEKIDRSRRTPQLRIIKS